MMLLRAQNIRKQFGERSLLSIGEVALETGQSYVLTGDNGSGKTTLLRILAGLEAGEIEQLEYRGRHETLKPYPQIMRNEIVHVHQQPYLFSSSLAANLAYGLRMRGIQGAERESRIAEAIEWAGLHALQKTPPHKFSGGEKQRVALARAKILRPALFLLDEPTANLDAESKQRVIDLIAALCADNVTVLVACHDRELIQLPHMRRLHLSQGKIDAS